MDNYTLEYRTFDDLLADAASDFKKYQLKDLIYPEDLIKVTKRVNYDLGLRIGMTKERVLELHKGKVRLPNDFYILNYALICSSYTTNYSHPQGTHTIEKIIGTATPEYQITPPEIIDLCTIPLVEIPCDPCNQCGEPVTNCEPCNTCCVNPESCSLNCNGELVQIVQVTQTETRKYSISHPLRLIQSSSDVDCDCPNLKVNSPYTAEIKNGFIHANYDEGKIYLNYEGSLENNQGELLVPNHPLLNEYYEYALKQRILENLMMNDEEVNPNKIQLIEQRFKTSRNNALSLVNTPNFAELKDLHNANRRAQYSKYYDMFKSSPRFSGSNQLHNSIKPWR